MSKSKRRKKQRRSRSGEDEAQALEEERLQVRGARWAVSGRR